MEKHADGKRREKLGERIRSTKVGKRGGKEKRIWCEGGKRKSERKRDARGTRAASIYGILQVREDKEAREGVRGFEEQVGDAGRAGKDICEWRRYQRTNVTPPPLLRCLALPPSLHLR